MLKPMSRNTLAPLAINRIYVVLTSWWMIFAWRQGGLYEKLLVFSAERPLGNYTKRNPRAFTQENSSSVLPRGNSWRYNYPIAVSKENTWGNMQTNTQGNPWKENYPNKTCEHNSRTFMWKANRRELSLGIDGWRIYCLPHSRWSYSREIIWTSNNNNVSLTLEELHSHVCRNNPTTKR